MKQPFVGSFNECCRFELAYRQKNRSLAAKFGLDDSIKEVEAWVDEQNALRCIASGHLAFVVMDGAPAALVEAGSKKNWPSAAAVVKGGKAAFAAYTAMFGNDGVVPRDLAEQRAQICVSCPQNDVSGGLMKYFVKAAAEQIMYVLGAIKDMDVRTISDDKLGVCKACMCPMRAKVHVPINVIINRMPHETWSLLPNSNPVCWIRRESSR